MSNTKIIEISVGIFVALGILALLVLAVNVSNVGSFSSGDKFTITASFDNVSGLKERSAVSMAGVTIGRVVSISVDSITYQAVVKMNLDARFNEVPMDSSVGIYTAGLLGEKYIGIEPGGAPDYLEEGSIVRLTQSSIILEKLISQFLFSQSSNKE